MDHVVAFLQGFNPQMIISILIMFWFLFRHIDGKFKHVDDKFEKMEEKMEEKFSYLDMKIEKQAQRTDHLYEMFIALLKEKKR